MSELYHSANGDRWYLIMILQWPSIRQTRTQSHQVARFPYDIGAFLSGKAKEKQELLQLIGTLVEERLPT
jgi:hypothetical protein